jgi:hypothetical protein
MVTGSKSQNSPLVLDSRRLIGNIALSRNQVPEGTLTAPASASIEARTLFVEVIS